jgi:hypothetical protein
VQLVLGPVDLPGLLEDLLRDLAIAARRVMRRAAAIFVPSTATIPTFTSPALAQSSSTPPNSSPIASS